jgi:hypothetical protein
VDRDELELGHLCVDKEQFPKYKECVLKKLTHKSFLEKTEVALSYFAFLSKTLQSIFEKIEDMHERAVS